MRHKGNACLILGTLMILAAAGLTGYNLMESGAAKESSIRVIGAMETAMQTEAEPEESPRDMQPDYVRFPDMEMPVISVDGTEYVGTLRIPLLELELPVISEWSYEGLKTAPCRYQGSAYSGGLIVMAHNYESHFGRLNKLRPGDPVSFTDTAGNEFAYRVADLEEIPGTDVDGMLAGDWDLTLFTCTYGGQSRVTVRCVAEG